MTKAQHIEQLGLPMLGIVFANGAHVRRFMQPEMSYHVLYDYFLRGNFGAGLGFGKGGGGTIAELRNGVLECACFSDPLVSVDRLVFFAVSSYRRI